jgi:hypothetical protein
MMQERWHTYHHAGVNALTGDWINVASGIAADHDMVTVCGFDALASQTEGGSTHAADLTQMKSKDELPAACKLASSHPNRHIVWISGF